MAKTKQYCVAENWGKGFIEHSESSKIKFAGYPGNVWQVPAHNKDANLWINKVLGVVKTLLEAQSIVDVEVTSFQNAWDADTVEGETGEQAIERKGERPADIILEE
tara:strand:- start:2047 stop:2364 length:318 start_codon:yes stop_codon:yes gene_type:complete